MILPSKDSTVNIIFWNITGIRSKKVIHRLKQLIDINNTLFTTIMEPMVDKDKIEGYIKFLGYQQCISNDNRKIWCFWNNISQISIINNKEQQISIKIDDGSTNHPIVITAVYAKCSNMERRELWSSLENISLSINGPWCIGGDYMLSWILKRNQMAIFMYRMQMSIDFRNCIDNCRTTNIGYTGPKFTWCNNRRPQKRNWKRLDRVFINDKWSQNFQNTTIRHLVRTRLDHKPLLMKSFDSNNTHIKYFKFLKFQTLQEGFHNLVNEVWRTNIIGNSMWRLEYKLKLFSRRLSQWSREEIGDIHEQVLKWEKKIQSLEELEIINNIEAAR